jgi:hypothetical protein
MILLVIVAHVSLTYMPYSPPWWYVVSEKTDPIFWLILNVPDLCVMPVLFFTAGYFTPASYRKRGFAGFLVDKIRHILIPWLLGIAVLIPLTMGIVGRTAGEIVEKLGENPFYFFDRQGHLWYLGILFLFFTAYGLWARLVPPTGVRRNEPGWKNAGLLGGCFLLSALLACLAVEYIQEYSEWIGPVRSIVRLRPVKIASYVCFFLLGMYGWRAQWFTAGGWMPRIGPWRLLSIGAMIGYMFLRIVVIPAHDAPIFTSVLLPVADMVCSYTSMMYLLLAAIRWQKSRAIRWLADRSNYSYGIYWIHEVPMFFYLYRVNELDIPIFFKWVVGIAFTCVVSWMITKYVLKTTPGLRKMF